MVADASENPEVCPKLMFIVSHPSFTESSKAENFFAQTAALAFGKTEEQVREEGTPEEIVPQ